MVEVSPIGTCIVKCTDAAVKRHVDCNLSNGTDRFSAIRADEASNHWINSNQSDGIEICAAVSLDQIQWMGQVGTLTRPTLPPYFFTGDAVRLTYEAMFFIFKLSIKMEVSSWLAKEC